MVQPDEMFLRVFTVKAVPENGRVQLYVMEDGAAALFDVPL